MSGLQCLVSSSSAGLWNGNNDTAIATDYSNELLKKNF